VTAREPVVALRPASENDQHFFGRVYASTRTDELAQVPWSDQQKATFLAQQFHAQTRDYEENYRDASFDVVLVDGAPAGRLIVHQTEEAVHVVDISLLPEFRGRGIGTRLLREVMDDDKPVQIHVEKHNPALHLYERLGFVPVEDKGVYLRLEVDRQSV
jgi:ribosomal protein S18 acetylase RimI-like enzyme